MSKNNPLGELIVQLSKLPGLGEKSAERMAFYLLNAPADYRDNLCKLLQTLKEVKRCPVCFNLTAESDRCHICRNVYRDKSVICVVEEVSDLWALEQTGAYQGLYHILGGRIAPLDEVGPDDLTLKPLFARIKNTEVQEIILANSPTLEGDATARYIQDKLRHLKIKVSRLARGIPAGSKIQMASRPMLTDALRERRTVNSNHLHTSRAGENRYD